MGCDGRHPQLLVSVVDRLVWWVVNPTSLKRGEGKVIWVGSYMLSMYAGIGTGGVLWDRMSRV